MREVMLSGLSAYSTYSSYGTAISLAVAGSILLAVSKGAYKRIGLISLALVCLNALPVLGWLIDRTGGYDIDISPYGTVPIALVIGCTAVRLKDTARHWISTLLIIVLTALTMTLPENFRDSCVSLHLDTDKVSFESEEVAKILINIYREKAEEAASEGAEADEGYITVIVPRLLAGEIGEVSPVIRVPVIDWREIDDSNVINMTNLAANNNSEVVVMKQTEDTEARMAAQGYTIRARYAGYEVFQRVE